MLAQSPSIRTPHEHARDHFFCFFRSLLRLASNHDTKSRVVVTHHATFGEWKLLASSHKSAIVRVVTIKHPPIDIEGVTVDNSMMGRVYELSPQLAMLMIAAGWVRSETRSHARRQHEACTSVNRRSRSDRRSAA